MAVSTSTHIQWAAASSKGAQRVPLAHLVGQRTAASQQHVVCWRLTRQPLSQPTGEIGQIEQTSPDFHDSNVLRTHSVDLSLASTARAWAVAHRLTCGPNSSVNEITGPA